MTAILLEDPWYWVGVAFLIGVLLGMMWTRWMVNDYWAGKAETGISMCYRGRFYKVRYEGDDQ